MFQQPNFVKNYYNDSIIIKFKNPNFSLFNIKSAPTCPVPLPVSAEINPNKHINKTVFVTPFTSKYFHLLLECFSLILELKNKVNLSDLVIVSPMPLDKETGLFKHFTNKYEYPYYDTNNLEDCHNFNINSLYGIKSSFTIIPDFCKYFGINLICIPEHEFNNTSFDYAYFIYGEKNKYVDDQFMFIDKEMFNRGTIKTINTPHVLVPIKIKKEYGIICPEIIQKEYTDYHMLLPHKTRKDDAVNSFKLLRSSYPKFDIIPGKKIYVSRKNFPDRNVYEEKYVEEYFKKLNYEIVYFENLNIFDQSRICQESEKIVCLYGTSLLNCGFCSDKTIVISIKYNIPKSDYTINSAYNFIFRENSIEHIELDYNGNDLLSFIENQEDLW